MLDPLHYALFSFPSYPLYLFPICPFKPLNRSTKTNNETKEQKKHIENIVLMQFVVDSHKWVSSRLSQGRFRGLPKGSRRATVGYYKNLWAMALRGRFLGHSYRPSSARLGFGQRFRNHVLLSFGHVEIV